MQKKKSSWVDKFLNVVETVGNKLPHPATLFLILTLIVMAISAIGSTLGWEVTYTGLVADGSGSYVPSEITVGVLSLLSIEGLKYIFGNFTTNFTSFAPLGTVLVALVGIGIAERSGLISIILRKVAMSTPPRLITAMIVFLGVMSNVASDAGYVVLPPLAALIFLSFKRHPIAGVAAAFAGVSGGFSANLMISTLDPLLGGFTQEAARILQPEYVVGSAANYVFMVVSTFVITIVGTIITEKVVEPRLGSYNGDAVVVFNEVTKEEKIALRYAGFAFLGVIAFVASMWFVLGQSLFLGSAIVPMIVLVFAFPGLVYGKAIKTIGSDNDVMKMVADSFATMSGYLVLVFFAAQFIAFFNYSKLGTLIAVIGADFLATLNAPAVVLLVIFIVIVAFINLFMGSASAKWAILAPVFVPMLMQLGISPEASQLAYRIGDSTTNLISPLMSYFPMMVVFVQKYDKKASLGTLISTMLPYSIAFLISWTALLAIWVAFNLPIGIGAGIFLG
ncbi:MAG: AbgT family transporter [Clostridia bacterium]